MDNNVKSYRKPYVQPVKANWWADRAFYIAYIIRECTSLFTLWVAVELIALVFFVQIGKANLCEEFLQNGFVIVLNIIALAAVLFHAFTWYNLMPKAVRVFLTKKPTDTKLLPAKFIVAGLWAGTIVSWIVCILALCLA